MSSICEKYVLKARALIFDMDGVITDTMPYHYQAWKFAFQEIVKKEISERDVYLREGSKGSFALQEIFEQYGWSFSPEVLSSLLMRKEEIFSRIVRVEFVEGALDFLNKKYHQGFLMALVTGTSRDELNRMLAEDIRRYFSVIVTGSDVINGKPHPEPYKKAVAALGIQESDAIVFENAPLGIQSAKSAGLRCIALATSLSNEFLRDSDFIFSSYADLNRQIKFLGPLEL